MTQDQVKVGDEIRGTLIGKTTGMAEILTTDGSLDTAQTGDAITLRFATQIALGSVFLFYLYPLRLTQHRLVATNIMHAIPLAYVAGFGYLFARLVDGTVMLSLLVGSVSTVILGSLLRGRISGYWIQIALAVALRAAKAKVLV